MDAAGLLAVIGGGTIKRTETFLLRQSLQSKRITALALDREFGLNQPSQMLEHSRLSQEESRHTSHQILAAQETDAGNKRMKKKSSPARRRKKPANVASLEASTVNWPGLAGC
jgi:hypothetical protein